MSGTFHISEEHGWSDAGWCYRVILGEILKELHSLNAPVGLIKFLEDPYEAPQLVEHVNLPDLHPVWRKLLAVAASSAYQRCRDHGFGLHVQPNFQQFILGAFRKLLVEMRDLFE